MNKIHRSLWNAALGAWVATSENAPARGKRSCRAALPLHAPATSTTRRKGARLAWLAAAVIAMWAPFADAARRQPSTWKSAGTGGWFDAANWTGGVPSTGTSLATVGNGGTAQIAGAAANISGAGLVIGDLSGNSGLVDVQAGGSLTATGPAGGVVLNTNGTLLLSGSTEVSSSLSFNGGTLRSTTTGLLTHSDIGVSNGSTGTIAVGTGSTLTLGLSFIQDDGTFKFGSATDRGVVVLGAADGLGVGTNSTFEVVGGTLRAGDAFSLNGLAQLNVSATVDAGATLDLNDFSLGIGTQSGGTLLGAGSITTGTNAATTLSLVNADFSGSISGAGQLALVGDGTVLLSGTNTYTGATTIDTGSTLRAGARNAFAPLSATSVATGATLDLNNFDQAIGSLAGEGSVVLGNATLTTGGDNTSTAFSGAISGSGGLGKIGTGTQTLSSINTYSGGTFLHAGQLALGNSNALGSGPLAMDPGTTLAFAADHLTLANPITFTGAGDPTFDTGAFTATLAGGISGPGDLGKIGSGTLILSGTNTYTGATHVAEGTLRASAANSFSPASAHTIAAGATLATGGFDQTLAGLSNSGTVSLLGAAPGSSLTVNGNYVGNNGVLKLGTALGDSSSVSDRLVLNGGRASGTTTVQITNLGGLGALTTGNGIEVIGTANGGSIDTDAFTLANGHVDAGAYEYRLNTTTSGGYLSSATPAPPVPSVQAAPGLPMYRSEVPLVAALPEQQRQADLAMLGNLHQRMGDDDVQSDVAGSSPDAGGGNEHRAWGRVLSTGLNIRQSGTVGPTSDGRLTGFQAGTDLLAVPHWHAGVYVGQLDGDMAVDGFARGVYHLGVGSNDLRNQYLGVYGTYTDDSGFYADAVVQAARHRFTVEPVTAFGVDGKGSGMLASIEAGQSFDLGGSADWRIEPQLQLVHSNQHLDDMIISGATIVAQHPDNGWLARLGMRIKGGTDTRAGWLQPYARLNVYRASSGSDIADFIGPAGFTPIQTGIGNTSTELAAGATLALSHDVSLYGELGKLWAFGGEARVKSTAQGSLGMRVRW